MRTPVAMVPVDTIPVNGGVNVTRVPGTAVSILSGTLEAYNCALIVTVEPTNESASVVLK